MTRERNCRIICRDPDASVLGSRLRLCDKAKPLDDSSSVLHLPNNSIALGIGARGRDSRNQSGRSKENEIRERKVRKDEIRVEMGEEGKSGRNGRSLKRILKERGVEGTESGLVEGSRDQWSKERVGSEERMLDEARLGEKGDPLFQRRLIPRT